MFGSYNACITLSLHLQRLLFALGVIVLVLIAFGMSLTFGFAPIDDYHLIVQNLAIRDMSFDGWKQMLTIFDPELYIPLTFLSFKIEALAAGMNPLIFHLDNLLLHVINALLVAWIIMRLSGSRTAGWCAALIFAVHPLNAETVVWISARKDVLATFFALLSIVFVLKSIDQENRWFWILSIAFFILALLSKISAVLLPLLIVVILLRERFTTRSAAVMLAPYVVAALALGLVAILGKGNVLASTPLLERIVLAGNAIALSIGHFFIPAHLTLYYTVPPITAATILIALIPVLLMIAAILFWKKSSLISIGIAWFFIFILPTVLNIQTDPESSGVTFASDRYLYLPMVGLLIALIGLICMIRPLLDDAIARWSVLIVTAIVLVFFVPATRAQVGVWSDADTLFSHAVAVSPDSVQTRIVYVEALKRDGNLQNAFSVLKQGLAYGDDERLHVEAGVLYAAADDTSDAKAEFSKARSVDSRSAAAIDGLAALDLHDGDTADAETLDTQSIAIAPDDTSARIALSSILQKKGDTAGAESQLLSVLAIDPSNIDALKAMATLLQSEGNDTEARGYLQKAALLQ